MSLTITRSSKVIEMILNIYPDDMTCLFNFFSLSIYLSSKVQFPTLGFIVERYWEVQSHEPEEFWAINCSHRSDEGTSTFNWMYNVTRVTYFQNLFFKGIKFDVNNFAGVDICLIILVPL